MRFRLFSPGAIELLDARIVLDAGMSCGLADFPESELVTQLEDGTLRFASLRVGVDARDGNAPLDDHQLIEVRGSEVSILQVKEYLHGFAEDLGTDIFPETLDFRILLWGSGSGSTTRGFEDFLILSANFGNVA